ncbi:GntR family transcriptional regulator/MocR family aminotransferase [Gemmobacter caeni]|uniref:GntR family transcriptional regulator n=1 Tax=Gemmobacter caeni TaxID=589035 RepID=A0A2T6A7M3_9RHOB|nr:PLP-dependent aminotransferase family protein [Gemmobacter caeni]PTX39752.1 GntR family transcriptional regulator [Gemmobacter caeni]TWI89843.1 GntR family transcriptional regulator/MocR family aminotransferase [Gemmobacter caeni]
MPIPVEAFFIDRTSPVPLQVQLRRQIVEGVTEGRFRPGDRLPSSRRMALYLGVARVTVAQAYAELATTDYLTSLPRSGHRISDRIEGRITTPAPAPDTPRLDWQRHIDGRFARSARTDRVVDWRRFRFPFVYGQADPELVDHIAWRECAVRALGWREFIPLTADLYGEDDPELIDYIARHILPRRGIRARPEEILLTLGAQNGLWLAAEVLLGRGGRCAVEDPCYPGLREILAMTRAEVSALPVDTHGLPPETIPPGVTTVFTTASHQCPTNSTMPLDRRRALLDRASSQGFAVIEDDYEFEMSFAGAPSPALKAMDAAGTVIYVGSFSKSVFPGLRLGYLVADPTFVAEARALRGLVMRHPPGMLQRTLAHFLSLGHYDAQMNRMRRVYAERRIVMAEAIAENGLTPASGGLGGSSFWMALPPGLDSRALSRDLRGEGVLIEPGTPFFATAEDGAGFYRLAYSSIGAGLIPEGIARIRAALRRS